MAEILRTIQCADGIDAQVRLSDGSLTWFHFAASKDLALAVDAAEAAWIAANAEPVHTVEITAEDGTVINGEKSINRN